MRHRAEDLLACASALLRAAGLPADRAAVVAEVLLESDLLGHDTHGLALLPAYLKDLDAGRMATAGDPDVLRDEGGSLTWDGKYLPGPWLIKRAIAAATVELAVHPLAAVAIRLSHHIGCLAAYPRSTSGGSRRHTPRSARGWRACRLAAVPPRYPHRSLRRGARMRSQRADSDRASSSASRSWSTNDGRPSLRARGLG